MSEYIFNLILNQWGVNKTAQVILYTLTGAVICAAISITVIPDKPMNNEKEIAK